MNKIHAIVLSSFFCLTALPYFASAEITDRIVAEVNDDVITLSELNEYAKPFFQNIMTSAPADVIESEVQKIRTEVLDRIINNLLIEQEAKKFGISVLESDVDSAINSIIAENNVTPEQFIQELERMGSNEKSYRENIKGQMLKSRMVNFEVRSKLVITDEKIQDYYDTNYQKQTTASEGYHILQIGFLWGEKNRAKSLAEARENAEMVNKLISAGEEFTILAKQYSDLPSAEDGGDIGTFKKEEMAPYMLGAIKDMQPGETSSIIETPLGFQILKLISANQDGIITQAPLDSVKSEITEIIYKLEMERSYEKWMGDVRDKAYISINL